MIVAAGYFLVKIMLLSCWTRLTGTVHWSAQFEAKSGLGKILVSPRQDQAP